MANKLSALLASQNMTQGSPIRNLIRFSVPLLIGNIVQQLYSTVDSIIVGQYIGDNALAAVGASGPLFNLLLVLFIGISIGASIMTSQYFGAKRHEDLSRTVGTAITLTFFISILITVLGAFITKPFLTLVKTPAEILNMSSDYLTILLLGVIGIAYYNILSGIIRSLGDSVTPLIFLMIACILNVFLDLYFVGTLNWGVAGAAWATIISQGFSAILCFFRLINMREVTLKPRYLIPSKFFSFQLAKLGIPSGITQAVMSLAGIVVQPLTNSFGTAVIACAVAVMRVDGFAMMPNFTFGTSMTTYSGQNIGAGRLDRVQKGTKDGLKLALLTSAFMVTMILIFKNQLLHLFTNSSEIINLASSMLIIMSPGYIAMAVTQVLSGVMRGAGETRTPMWISMITTVLLRIPTAYLIVAFTKSETMPNGSPYAIFISLVVSWVMGGVITLLVFKRGGWKKKSLIENNVKIKKTAEVL